MRKFLERKIEEGRSARAKYVARYQDASFSFDRTSKVLKALRAYSKVDANLKSTKKALKVFLALTVLSGIPVVLGCLPFAVVLAFALVFDISVISEAIKENSEKEENKGIILSNGYDLDTDVDLLRDVNSSLEREKYEMEYCIKKEVKNIAVLNGILQSDNIIASFEKHKELFREYLENEYREFLEEKVPAESIYLTYRPSKNKKYMLTKKD